MKDASGNDLFPKTKATLVDDLPTLSVSNEKELGAPALTKDTTTNAYSLQATLLYDIITDSPSYTFGTTDSHTKAKSDAVVGEICFYEDTPVGVVVITGEVVKIMSLQSFSADGTPSLTEQELVWSDAVAGAQLYSVDGATSGGYLPTKEDFNNMDIVNNYVITKATKELGSSVALAMDSIRSYWSSTEFDSDDAYYYS